jgi:dipeptidyl-peptidase-4
MRPTAHVRHIFLSLLATVCCVLSQCGFAASPSDDSWTASAKLRLEQIYDDSTFRAPPLDPAWSDDSTQFRLRSTASSADQPAWLWIQAATGDVVPPPASTPADGEARREAHVSPDRSHRFVRENGDLLIRSADARVGEPVITIPGSDDVEFSEMSWSPNSRYLALVQSDRTNVRKRTMLVPDDPSYPGVRERHFARVGETIETLRVGLVDTTTKTLSWVDLDPVSSDGQQGFYLGQVEWAPNSNELLIEKLSRFRDRRQFLLVNPETNQITPMFDETNDAWAVSSQGKNLGLTWLDGGSKFIVISEKDGWRHAFLYSRDGDELATLTPGAYDIIERGPVDEAAGWFYFYASPDNATQKYLYRVALTATGELERVTPTDQPGTHDYNFSPNLAHAIHTFSTINTPPVVSLVSLPNHDLIKVLQDNQAIQTVLDEWGLPPTEFITIETEPGVLMDALVMKPRHFDPQKKYPVLVYVYGEPHGQTVLDQWAAGQSLFHRVITDLGYVVVSIDNRGTPAPKGAAWRRSVFGSLGPLSTEDQAAAIEKLGEMRPFVDLERVAIWGWSGGGSNTLNALFRKPNVYKVGIAVVPKPQPHLYNAWFQEIYMRTREVNPEGYERSAPLHFADGLAGKLLIVTGSGETNTHIQIIEGLIDRLVELGKPFDYMVYPNRDHGLSEGPGSRVHVRMLIVRYLIENLPRAPR